MPSDQACVVISMGEYDSSEVLLQVFAAGVCCVFPTSPVGGEMQSAGASTAAAEITGILRGPAMCY